MLTILRAAAGTWVAKLLLLLLVLSFAVWGISGSMVGGVGNNVLVAGGTGVSMQEYRLAYDRQINMLSQQFGQRITREQAKAFGIDQQVLAQLAAGAVLDEQANDLGLGISRERVAELTFSDPAFHGPDGQFNRQQFEYVLNQVGMRPNDYLQDREKVSKRQQIVVAATDGLKAPDTFLRALALHQGEDRTVEYVAIPRTQVEPVADPAADVLSKWFEERKNDYAAPEYRAISYIKLEPEDILDEKAISDEDVKSYYDKNQQAFTTPEQRTIDQIVFADADAAKAAMERIRGGASFEDVMSAEKKTPQDVRLGTFAKSGIADPAIAEAAFALELNAVSDVVQGSFGPILLRVTEIKPAVARPFEQVSSEIRHDLAMAEARRVLLDVHDAYEDARAAGDTLQEAAQKQNLTVTKVPAIDRRGQDPEGNVINSLPESAALIREAFETEQGIENPAINIGNSGYLFFEVDGITPPRDRTLDEVRDRVVADWKTAEAESRLSALAEEKRKAVADGASLDEVATQLGLTKETKRGLKRTANDADFGENGIASVFSVAQNGVGAFTNPGGDARILFKVTEVFAPAAAGPDAIADNEREALAQAVSNDLLDELVAELQTRYEVTVNQRAIDQALSF
jgi:peptidyl-prolyl cis-trans isomerase D